MIDWANANAGFLAAVFSSVVMLATVVYAILTWRLVAETEELRRVQTDPRISMSLEPSRRAINVLELYVKNIGGGPAYDVRLKITSDVSTWLLHKQPDHKLEELGIFREPIPYLGPQQEIRTFVGDAPKLVKQPIRGFTVRAEYRGLAKFRASHDIELSFAPLLQLMQHGDATEAVVAQSLKRIADHLRVATNGSRRLRVETISQAELREENRRLLKHLRAEPDGPEGDAVPHAEPSAEKKRRRRKRGERRASPPDGHEDAPPS